MSKLLGRRATYDLTRIGLVLAPGRGRRAWLRWLVLVSMGALLGVGASYLVWGQPLQEFQQQAAVVVDQQKLQQRLEQSQLTQRVSEARSQELERQIATLNQQLRESQEELMFFRKARDGKRQQP